MRKIIFHGSSIEAELTASLYINREQDNRPFEWCGFIHILYDLTDPECIELIRESRLPLIIINGNVVYCGYVNEDEKFAHLQLHYPRSGGGTRCPTDFFYRLLETSEVAISVSTSSDHILRILSKYLLEMYKNGSIVFSS